MTATVTLPVFVWTLVTAVLIVWIALRPRERAPWQILAMIIVFGIEPFSSAVMNAESRAFPLKYDHYLQAIDQAIGVTAFSVARIFTPRETATLFVIYESLSFAMIAWYAWHVLAKDGNPRQLIYAYLLAYCAGPGLYLLVPACGPRHAYPGLFPLGQPALNLVLVPLNYWPNAMPSLHMTSALMMLLLAGRNAAMKMVGWLFLAGTALATLAFEHYVIDLVVAVPFACCAVMLIQRRAASASLNLTLVLAWLLLIRFETPFLLAHVVWLRLGVLATLALGLRLAVVGQPGTIKRTLGSRIKKRALPGGGMHAVVKPEETTT